MTVLVIDTTAAAMAKGERFRQWFAVALLCLALTMNGIIYLTSLTVVLEDVSQDQSSVLAGTESVVEILSSKTTTSTRARTTRRRRSSHGGIPVKFWNDTRFGYVQRKYNHSYALHETRYPTRIAPAVDEDDDQAEGRHDDSSFTVRAVYYVNTKLNGNYSTWIRGQFRILPTIDELHIVVDAWSCQKETALYDDMAWLHEVRHEDVIELHCYDDSVETYEYHGIHKLWELGQQHSKRSDVALYFHSKGVTHAPSFEKYQLTRRIDSALTRNVFGGHQLDRMLEAFSLFPDVDKAGYDCSNKGFVWYNFFLVRGSYLNQLEAPVVTDRRHYYEDYLARWGLAAQLQSSLPITERRLEEYPDTSRRCYALSGDRIRNAANIGFYHDPNVESSFRNRERLPLGV